jgi:hypothetical protein
MTTKKTKQPVQREALRVRAYPVLENAVEVGVNGGWNRAHKHVDNPDEQHVKDEIKQYVLNAICEAFDFEDEAF